MYGIGHPALNASADAGEFVGIVMDVTERTRAVALRDGESRILEMIARDAPLEEILENLVHGVEAQFTGLLCSHGAGSMPPVCGEGQLCVSCEFVTINSRCMDFLRSTPLS